MVPSVVRNMKWIILLCFIVECRQICAQDELETDTSELPETIQQEAVPNVTTILYQAENTQPIELSSQSNAYIPEIATVQKCCGINEEMFIDPKLQKGVCSKSTTDPFVVEIFTFNDTHYWNYTNSNQQNVEIHVNDPCNEIKVFLDPSSDVIDTYRLLSNGSLYMPQMYVMHGLDKYCIDTLHDENTSFITAFICEPSIKPSVMYIVFGIGQIISCIFLIILAVFSMKRSDIDEDHKKCLAWFSGMRAFAFLVSLINTFTGIYLHEYINIFMGYSMFYLTLNYYIWLNILCWDTWRCIEAGNDNTRKSQMTNFILFAFLLPVPLLAISLFDFPKPVIPRNYINLYAPSEMAWLILIPIGLSCSLNVCWCAKMNLPKINLPKIRQFDTLCRYLNIENRQSTPSVRDIKILRNMYRRSSFLFFVLLFMWLVDVVMVAISTAEHLQTHNMIHDVTTCLQGVIISLIFVPKPCRKEPKHEDYELQAIKNDE